MRAISSTKPTRPYPAKHDLIQGINMLLTSGKMLAIGLFRLLVIELLLGAYAYLWGDLKEGEYMERAFIYFAVLLLFILAATGVHQLFYPRP